MAVGGQAMSTEQEPGKAHAALAHARPYLPIVATVLALLALWLGWSGWQQMQDDSRRATLEQGRDMAAQSMQRALKADLDKLTERLASRTEEHTSELQSLIRIPYAVFCLQQK